MHLHPHARVDVVPAWPHTQQVLLKLRATRRQAALAGPGARLACLARHMPQANPVTLAVTAAILEQYHLGPPPDVYD